MIAARFPQVPHQQTASAERLGVAHQSRWALRVRRWPWLAVLALSLGLFISTQASAGDHGRHRGHHQQRHYSGHGHSGRGHYERRDRRHHGHSRRDYGHHGDHGYRRSHHGDRHYRRHHDYGYRRHGNHHGYGYSGPYRRGYGHHDHHRHDSAYVLGALLPLITYGHYYD